MVRKYICKDREICPQREYCIHAIPHYTKEDCDDICSGNIVGGCIPLKEAN